MKPAMTSPTATRNGKARKPAPKKCTHDDIPPPPTPEQAEQWGAEARARIAASDAAWCALEMWLKDSDQFLTELLEGATLLQSRLLDENSAYCRVVYPPYLNDFISVLRDAKLKLGHCGNRHKCVIHRPPARALLAIPGEMPKGGEE